MHAIGILNKKTQKPKFDLLVEFLRMEIRDFPFKSGNVFLTLDIQEEISIKWYGVLAKMF